MTHPLVEAVAQIIDPQAFATVDLDIPVIARRAALRQTTARTTALAAIRVVLEYEPSIETIKTAVKTRQVAALYRHGAINSALLREVENA